MGWGRRRRLQATHRARAVQVGRPSVLAMLAWSQAPVLRVAPGGRALHLDRSPRGAGTRGCAVGAPARAFVRVARVSLPSLTMSFVSSAAFRRFLAAPGPVVIYGLFSLFSAWCAWHAGTQSSGAVVMGFLALFFAGVVAGELRYFRTARHRY